jgi:hypothetical protein
MSETPERLAARLQAEGEKTRQFLADLSREQYLLPVYSEGVSWNIQDILAHFISAEKAFLLLLENVLQGGPGAPEGFDIDRFNEAEVKAMQDLPVDELLAGFEQQRLQTIAIVNNMSVEDLRRIGRHPFLGQTEMEDFIKLIYRHNQLHLRDIKRAMPARS